MIETKHATVYLGSNLDVLPTLEDNSVDSIVTDPPYGLSDSKYVADTIIRWINGERDFIPDGKGFMGKSWDSFVPPPALWDECLRVLKPGGHLLAFFGSRTQDIGALSIRLAGFEIRDSIAWMYGSGFPKSMDVSKAIDKQSGYEGEVIRTELVDVGIQGGSMHAGRNTKLAEREIKELSSQAKQWEGWGTALKPAFEPIVVARKPLIGTVAANVLEHGTGALNIDGSRIGTEQRINQPAGNKANADGVYKFSNAEVDAFNGANEKTVQGRWPANVILDEYSAEILDEQSEASRFFYVAKTSKTDRNEGLNNLDDVTHRRYGDRNAGSLPKQTPQSEVTGKNFHPTVKPTNLMRYLVKLVTPPGGTVLDPFTGSGSTGKAAILEGFNFVGIEITEDYMPIIEGRLIHAEAKLIEAKEKEEEQLF